MNYIQIPFGSTTYIIFDEHVPHRDEAPSGGEQCDAFIAILDPTMVTERLADQVSIGLLKLHTDWIETMGRGSESLHDRIDEKSVALGAQAQVGGGRPMTAWHEEFDDLDVMAEYVRLGGQGASRYKLVFVIGPEHSAAYFADRLRSMLSASSPNSRERATPNGSARRTGS